MVAGKLAADARTAGVRPLPANTNVNTLKANSPTRLKAIPVTAPKIAYCILTEMFLISKQTISRHRPNAIEKIYKNGLMTSCFCLSPIITTSNTLPIVVDIIRNAIPTIKKNVADTAKNIIGDFLGGIIYE